MPLYNLSTIIYIVLQFISIFLLGVLVFALLTSTPQFSHTTLLQLFISAFLFNSIGLLPLLMFGDDLKIIGVHSLLCIICQKFTAFLFLPTHIFPVVLVFYLWYALVRGDLRIEQKCLYYVSGTVWLYTICNSIASILIERNHDNFGTTVSLYMCVEVFGDRRYYGYVIPNMILTGLSIPMSCHSGYILWKRWKTFSSNQNRSTAIKLGHSVRLCVFSSISSVFLMATLIPRMIMYHETNPILQYILAFSTALLGVLLFLVFGSNRKAAIFLPCCYYIPPTIPPPSSPDYSEQNEHELRTFASVTINPSDNSCKTDAIQSEKNSFVHWPNTFGEHYVHNSS